MTHLSPQQFIALLDGRVDPDCRAHLEHCAPCRDEVAELRAITAAAAGNAAVPEPSPLFWQHFTDRVQQAVAAEPVIAPAWWRGLWRPVAGIGVALACVALVILVRTAGPSADLARQIEAVNATRDSVDPSDLFVSQLAASVSWEDLQRVVPTTTDGAADVMASLTPAERAAFVRLLSKSRPDGEE